MDFASWTNLFIVYVWFASWCEWFIAIIVIRTVVESNLVWWRISTVFQGFIYTNPYIIVNSHAWTKFEIDFSKIIDSYFQWNEPVNRSKKPITCNHWKFSHLRANETTQISTVRPLSKTIRVVDDSSFVTEIPAKLKNAIENMLPEYIGSNKRCVNERR